MTMPLCFHQPHLSRIAKEKKQEPKCRQWFLNIQSVFLISDLNLTTLLYMFRPVHLKGNNFPHSLRKLRFLSHSRSNLGDFNLVDEVTFNNCDFAFFDPLLPFPLFSSPDYTLADSSPETLFFFFFFEDWVRQS